jgi:hypothetical protein
MVVSHVILEIHIAHKCISVIIWCISGITWLKKKHVHIILELPGVLVELHG